VHAIDHPRSAAELSTLAEIDRGIRYLRVVGVDIGAQRIRREALLEARPHQVDRSRRAVAHIDLDTVGDRLLDEAAHGLAIRFETTAGRAGVGVREDLPGAHERHDRLHHPVWREVAIDLVADRPQGAEVDVHRTVYLARDIGNL